MTSFFFSDICPPSETCLSLRVQTLEDGVVECAAPVDVLVDLQVISGDFVKLSSAKKETVARCFSLDTFDTIGCSRQLMLFLGVTETETINIYKYNHRVDTADHVKLQRVRCPGSSGTIDYTPRIQSIFKDSECIVRTGFTFAVDTNIFFQCTEVNALSFSEFAIVDTSKTTIELNGSVYSFSPYPLVPFPSSEIYDQMSNLMEQRKPLTKALLEGPRFSGKRFLLQVLANNKGYHYKDVNAFELIGTTFAETRNNLIAVYRDALHCSPMLFHLRRCNAFEIQQRAQAVSGGLFGAPQLLKELFDQHIDTGFPFFVVLSFESFEDCLPELRALFSFEFSMSMPSASERQQLLSLFVSQSELSQVIQRTAGFSMGMLKALTAEISKENIQVPKVIEEVQKRYSASESTLSIPKTLWSDVGGLETAKEDLLNALELPLKHAHILKDSLLKPRAGLLLFGPPGTGKTLLAKAVATECAFSFLSVKGPELLNMYVGESEANVRKVFERAKAAKPCVLFFDELDALAPFRGLGSDSSGVMDRVVSQLLAELDGISGEDVFVLAATNRPDLVDPALLRPGRLDKAVYLGVSKDPKHRANILKALVQKMVLDANLDLDELSLKCPENFTGADLYALASDALMIGIRRKVEQIEEKLAVVNAERREKGLREWTANRLLEDTQREDRVPVITMEDFEKALLSLTPSVSEAELLHYEKLREQFT